jgi:hypothetical protein
MLKKFQEFLKTTGGRLVAGLLFVLAMGFIAYSFWTASASSRFTASSNDRVFVCSETGKSFHYTIKLGDSIPVQSPYSGKATGYPAELCYWTADGKTKEEPTPVLLNTWIGKKGRTFCPDCGRVVVSYNPAPVAGAKAPPKESEIRPGGGIGIEEQNQGE